MVTQLTAMAFVRHWFDTDGNGTEAVRRTYPDRKYTEGSLYYKSYSLLRDPKVKEIIATKLRTEEEIQTLLEDVRRRAQEKGDLGNELRAIENEGRLIAAFKDKSEVTHKRVDPEVEEELASLRGTDLKQSN